MLRWVVPLVAKIPEKSGRTLGRDLSSLQGIEKPRMVFPSRTALPVLSPGHAISVIECPDYCDCSTTDMHFMAQFALYARLETMFVIMAFSPSRQCRHLEFVFGGFLSDYAGISLIVALIWRYWRIILYLLAGWSLSRTGSGVINRRRVEKLEQTDR